MLTKEQEAVLDRAFLCSKLLTDVIDGMLNSHKEFEFQKEFINKCTYGIRICNNVIDNTLHWQQSQMNYNLGLLEKLMLELQSSL